MKTILTWLVCAVVMLAHAQAHAAQSASEEDTETNLVDEMCGAFDRANRQNELGWLKYEFLNTVPASQAHPLGQVEFVITDETNSLGPVFIGGARQRVEFGPRFMHDLCLGAAFSVGVLQDEAGAEARFKQVVETCEPRGLDAFDCYRDAVRGAVRGARTVVPDALIIEGVPYAQTPDELIQQAHIITLAMARFLIAHEAAHAVFRLPGSTYDLSRIDEEFEADLFAYRHTLSEDPTSAVAIMSPFSSQLIVEEEIGVRLSPTHSPIACRMRRGAQIQRALFGPAGRLNLIVQGREAERGLIANFEQFLAELPPLPGEDADCVENPDNRLLALRKDIMFVESALEPALDSENREVAMRGVLESFDAREFSSVSARQLAANAAGMVALRDFAEVFARMADPTQPRTPQALADVRRAVETLTEVFGENPAEVLVASELVNLRRAQGVSSAIVLPPGTAARPTNRRLAEQLGQALTFLDPVTKARHAAYLGELFPGAEASLVQDLEGLLNLYVGAAGGSGDCALVQSSLDLAWEVLAITKGEPQPSGTVTPEGCETLMQQTLQLQKDNLGWSIEP